MAIKFFFLSLSLSLPPSLSHLLPSPFPLFHSLTCLLTRARTHTLFFSSPVCTLPLVQSLTLLLARLSQHPPCCPSSFILFLLPPSLPPPTSLSLSHTHTYIHTNTHTHTPIYIFQLHLWQVVISTVRNCFFNISLSNYEPRQRGRATRIPIFPPFLPSSPE